MIAQSCEEGAGMRRDVPGFLTVVLSLAAAAGIAFALMHLREQTAKRPAPDVMPVAHAR
jgi:hypothetical protein